MMTTYRGGCHCGTVRFACDLDPGVATSRCSCSICAKGRFWKAIVKGQEFRLLEGEDALAEYSFGHAAIRHFFCKYCGIKPFGRSDMTAMGGVFYAINVACLDDEAPERFAAREIVFEDGRNDDWSKAPAETRHL